VSRLLDTNVYIRLINRSPGAIVERLRSHGPQSIRLSAITKAELFYGARHSNRVSENLQLVTAF
jgi:tRNA(fMet)-specific endonuclease VapC